jgi:hypothetical protein
MDLVHWIKIQRPRSTAGDKAGLTGMSRSDQRRGAIGTAGCTSDNHDPAQAGGTAAAAHCGGAQRRKTASSPALKRSGAAVHQKRRERHHNDQERAANPTAGTRSGDSEARWSHDESPRRRSFGEGEPATRSTDAQTNSTGGLLTSRRLHWAVARRPNGGGTAASERNRSGGARWARVWGGGCRR